MKKHMIAFDCSNSSVRTILGTWNGEKLSFETVSQSPNEPIRVLDYEYWNILEIYSSMLRGLKLAAERVERIDSIGVCTWGVDFGLLTREGVLLGNPLAYRNPIGGEMLDSLSRTDRDTLFRETGILCDKINSIFMLMGIKKHLPSLVEAADKLLTVPDLFHYLLTGAIQNEPSEFSTTQLMDVRTRTLSPAALAIARVQADLFPPLGEHGTRIGYLSEPIRKRLGIGYDIPVVCVPSHDTAAAILAVPAAERDFAYISSGTWALVGTELETPIINQAAADSGLTNELGAFGRITLLKNHAGMFIVQKLREEWDPDLPWEDLYALSDSVEGSVPLFDVNAPEFFNPESMTRAIWEDLRKTGQVNGEPDLAVIVRSFLLSMALGYRTTIAGLEQVTDRRFDTLYIVGGGGNNHRLCQLAADYTGKPVVVGSSESTSLGNLAAQLKYFDPDLTVTGLRTVIRNSIETKSYTPHDPDPEVLRRYGVLMGIQP